MRIEVMVQPETKVLASYWNIPEKVSDCILVAKKSVVSNNIA